MTNREANNDARRALGERIRALRTEQKLTVRGFALMIGLSKDYIIDIEYGRKSPTFDTLLKIASGLDITPSELLRGVGEPDEAHRRKPAKQQPPEYFHTNL